MKKREGLAYRKCRRRYDENRSHGETERVRVRLRKETEVAALNPRKTPTFGYSVSSSFESLGF